MNSFLLLFVLAPPANLEMTRLAVQMGSDDFIAREHATEAIYKLGPSHYLQLELIAWQSPDPEVRARCRHLLARHRWQVHSDLVGEKTPWITCGGMPGANPYDAMGIGQQPNVRQVYLWKTWSKVCYRDFSYQSGPDFPLWRMANEWYLGDLIEMNLRLFGHCRALQSIVDGQRADEKRWRGQYPSKD